MMVEVELHEWAHVLFQVVRRSESVQKRIRQGRSSGFMTGTDPSEFAPTFTFFGGGGFAEIMREHGEGELTPVSGWGVLPFRQIHERIEAVLGVRKRVAFGMPFGILRCAVKGYDFWEMPQPISDEQHIEAARWFYRLRGPLIPFTPNAFYCQLAKGRRDRTAQHNGFGREGEIKPGSELESSQDSQRIFSERFAGMAKHATLQVFAAIVWID